MRAQELLDTLSDEDLKNKANECFIEAEKTNVKLGAGASERQRLLTEADFYLRALVWREDARVAVRDFRLEKIVIVLISIEIALSLIFGGFAIYEGIEQSVALDHMDTSTAATATAMQSAQQALQTLKVDQEKSLDRLKDMNDNLQASMKATGRMATATQTQLAILRQDQAERAAIQSKKPKLILYVGPNHTNLSQPGIPTPPREVTDTSVTFDFYLTNEGTATATKVELRAQVGATGVTIETPSPHQQIIEPVGSLTHTFLIDFDFLRKNTQIPTTITFRYTKGQAAFPVTFTVDADQIDTGTPLGQFWVEPKR